jgi:hypothetical protein
LWQALPLAFQPFGPQPLATRAQHMASLGLVRVYLDAARSRDEKTNWLDLDYLTGLSLVFFDDILFQYVPPTACMHRQQWRLKHLNRQQLLFCAWNISWLILWCTTYMSTWMVLVPLLSGSNCILGVCYSLSRIVAVTNASHHIFPHDSISWVRKLDALYQATRWKTSSRWWWMWQEMARSINLQLTWSLLLLPTACLVATIDERRNEESCTMLRWLYASGLATSRDIDRMRYYPRAALWLFLASQCIVPMLVIGIGGRSITPYLLCLAWWIALAYARAKEHAIDRTSLRVSALALRTLVAEYTASPKQTSTR